MAPLTAAIPQLSSAGWIFLIPLLPLVGAAINGLFGAALQRRFGARVVHVVAIGVMLAAAGLALGAVGQLAALPPSARYLHDRVFPMLAIGQLHVDCALAVDPLSAVMLLVITLVGTLIHVYSAGYMHDDPAQWRFFAYLNLFIFAMLLLVMGDGFVTLFFGWEGVGLCSYLLIGFWYRERRNASAGFKAFVVNRVGDWGFIAALLLLFWSLGGSWSAIDHRYYPDDPAGRTAQLAVAVTEQPTAQAEGAARHALVNVAPTVVFRELQAQLAVTDESGARPLAEALRQKTLWGIPVVTLIALFLLLAATGKSAQLPLYVWLPDAMAGPTPVSALIHAATMVTAGVYLMVRLSFLIVLAPAIMTAIAIVGAATALFAAVIALFQYDIKKVLAYSTVSQLGFMFVAVGVGSFWTAVFHLVTHACFKACLFLGAGSVIHGMHRLTHARSHRRGGAEADAHDQAHGDDDHAPARLDPRLAADPTDPQDLRNMGGLGALMPTTRWTYFIACWAISGLPLGAGFFSKDEILASAFGRSGILWALGLTTALCTAFYSFRAYYMAFWARPASDEQRAHVVESPRSMTGPLLILGALCLLVGPALGLPLLLTHHEPWLAEWLLPVTQLSQAWLPRQSVGPIAGAPLEGLLLLASLAAAFGGWLGARALYRDLGATSQRLVGLRSRFAALHALVYDRFGVDELYDRTVVRSFGRIAHAAAWLDLHVVDGIVGAVAALARAAAALSGIIDRYVVDGAVDGVANALLGSGRTLRRMQTGRINNYVLGVAVGIVLLIVLTSWL
jgi:NADH:ubiquinone oxidoreductase subunit 5 (subunit L)/multisubunit Na+/H+ antiporter MnhA subunit